MFSLPPGTEMFQFPGFPVPALCVQAGLTGHDPSRVSPFGDPWIVGWLTPPQGLSQFPTSFIGSRCQGIHRVLFFTCRKDCSRSLWSSQGSPTRLVDGLPVGDRWFHLEGRAAEGERSLRAAQGAKRGAGSTARSHLPERASSSRVTPRAVIQRTSAPTSQWFTGSRTTRRDRRSSTWC